MTGDARALAVADGHLLVSTDAGTIYCFGASATANSAVVTEAKNDVFPVDGLSELYRTAAAEILKHTGAKAGYCLVVGSEEGRLAL